jgi:hypothetical protein
MKRFYRFFRAISMPFRGNVNVQSGTIVVLICVVITLRLVEPDKNLLAGALIGAAVSIVAAALIEFLKAPGGRKIPDQFITGAQREVDMIGYYRENQEVHIELVDSESDKEIKMIFNSKVVPIRDGDLRLQYPKIKAPTGWVQTKIQYKLGTEIMSEDSQPHLTGAEEECLIVEYKIQPEPSEYSDEHIWSSPVLRYDVYFKVPSKFECRVFERVGDDNVPVKPSMRLGWTEKRFPQPHPVFSRQGFRWRIAKAKA